MGPTSPRLVLRDLPLPARLVLSAFLVSVGIGYFAALVQLHLQHASPGNLLPTADDAKAIFAGKKQKDVCKVEALLEADEKKPFNGTGQMHAAFTTKSIGWDGEIDSRAEKLAGEGQEPTDPQRAQAEAALREERETERLAVIAWVRAGAPTGEWEQNRLTLPEGLKQRPLTEKYLVKEGKKPAEPRSVKLFTLLKDRCIRCHKPDASNDNAKNFPLNDHSNWKPYTEAKESSTAMSVEKLTQSTHVHLLGFSMLYGLTGLIFAFTSFPGLLRVVLAPLPLVAQVVDIGCWWLARVDPIYAHVIVYTGGVVAAGLAVHVVLGLWDMYGRAGKAVLVLLLVAGALGAWQAKERYLDPYLAQEKAGATAEK
jgi:hypothetical protein